MMVTITWNPLKFHLLNALPKGSSFTKGKKKKRDEDEEEGLPP
jgi:hypothetical protein